MSATPTIDPYRPLDPEARALARRLVAEARFAALAVVEADGLPFCSRIAIATSPEGLPLGLLSGLAQHTRALRANPACCLLLGEPGEKGDPLSHPRLSLRARARFIPRSDEGDLRAAWVKANPKARIYADLPDFSFVVFDPVSAALNGGFARAFRLDAADLAPED